MLMGRLLGNNKTYIFVGIGILLVVGAWWGLSGGTPSDSLLTTQSTSNLSDTEKGLVDTLLQLRAVTLSGTIFSDPAFMVLRDFGTQIVPEPVGRLNPFAPATGIQESAATPGGNQSSALPLP